MECRGRQPTGSPISADEGDSLFEATSTSPDDPAGLPPHTEVPRRVACLDDRARRGISGALYPQSALAGPNARLRVAASGASTPWAALTVRSRAMRVRESGQVRKEAALSGSGQVPRASLTRANRDENARGPLFEAGPHGHFLTTG